MPSACRGPRPSGAQQVLAIAQPPLQMTRSPVRAITQQACRHRLCQFDEVGVLLQIGMAQQGFP